MYANVVKIEAKPERAKEVAAWLAAAAERLAPGEQVIRDFYVLQASATSFWIFDTFRTDADQKAHADGPVAQALMSRAAELLAVAPEISPGILLAFHESDHT